MKKVIGSALCMLLLTVAFANLSGQDKEKLEKYTNDELGISFEYPSFYWQIFLDRKKIDGYIIKDFVVMKKKEFIEHIKFHTLLLVNPADYILKYKKFRDNILKDRIKRMQQYRGLVNRKLTSEENSRFGCEEGQILGYEYNNRFKETSTIYLYFLKKGSKLFAIEYLADKQMPRGHVPEEELNKANPILAEMKKIVETIRLK